MTCTAISLSCQVQNPSTQLAASLVENNAFQPQQASGFKPDHNPITAATAAVDDIVNSLD